MRRPDWGKAFMGLLAVIAFFVMVGNAIVYLHSHHTSNFVFMMLAFVGFVLSGSAP